MRRSWSLFNNYNIRHFSKVDTDTIFIVVVGLVFLKGKKWFEKVCFYNFRNIQGSYLIVTIFQSIGLEVLFLDCKGKGYEGSEKKEKRKKEEKKKEGKKCKFIYFSLLPIKGLIPNHFFLGPLVSKKKRESSRSL